MYGFESIYRILKKFFILVFIPLFYFLKNYQNRWFLYDGLQLNQKLLHPIHCDENCKINY